MGWEDYVTNMMTRGACHCGVYTKQGAACAQSEGFNMAHTEVLALQQAMTGADAKIEINGQPCTMISFNKEDGTIQAKTKNAVFKDAKIFYHVESTKTLLVVCGKVGAGEREANGICNAIACHLKEANC